MLPHRGTLILVLGILSITICWPCGPFAWMLGNEDLAKMRAGLMDPSGEGNTNAGRILGMIGTVLIIGLILLWIASFFLFAASVDSATSTVRTSSPSSVSASPSASPGSGSRRIASPSSSSRSSSRLPPGDPTWLLLSWRPGSGPRR